jgi:hypothetical protein
MAMTVATCPACLTTFTGESILHNREVWPLGLQLADDRADGNCFHFRHKIRDCGATFRVPADALASLLAGCPPAQTRFDTDDCEQHCRDLTDRMLCRAVCQWAPYRQLLNTLIANRCQVQFPGSRRS